MGEKLKIPYVKFSENPVMDFFKRFYLTDIQPTSLIIVSPFIGSLSRTRYSFERLNKRIDEEKIPTYIITREPYDEYHKESMDILSESNFVEIRYNNSLHAKLYICMGRDTGFAILGSGNLSRTSMEQSIEIGLLVLPHDRGKLVLNELYKWGSIRLRTLKESKLAKKIHIPRRIK